MDGSSCSPPEFTGGRHGPCNPDPNGNPFAITSYGYSALEPSLRREGH